MHKPTSAALAATLAGAVCAGLVSLPAAQAHPRHAHRAPAGDPDVVTEWDQIGVATIAADNAAVPARKQGIEVYLYLAFMHTAMYNAVVGIEGRYRPYRFHARPAPGASAEAAAVAAAHRVLVTYSPEQAATLDAAYAASLADVPDGRAEDRGVAYGERAAAALVRQRADDGRNAPITFDQAPAPGIWRPTPPGLVPFSAPWLGYVDPLTVRSGAQFGEPGPPPSLTSRRYTRDFLEVKALGSATSTERTAAQTETALLFGGNPIAQYASGLVDQAQTRGLDLVDSARMFAAVFASMADATISIWHAKHLYGGWRPITAIALADTDGNPATTPDPSWTSVIATPPYPDWVSGYCGVLAAYVQSLQVVLGTRHLHLTLTSTALPGVTRFYETGPQARTDVVNARVWLGLHFRFADEAADRMGLAVARYGMARNFRPVH